jgi:hypothetical protein
VSECQKLSDTFASFIAIRKAPIYPLARERIMNSE